MFSRFFIDRPIFAAVLSIVITLTGSLALANLPVAQYPEISPPSVQISINYPGASAKVVADTVAAPIEQQVNGVPKMLYMSSQSGNDGSYTLTVTFDIGTDLNTALVMVQNRVTLALPQLPDAVQLQGITVRKKTPDILLVVSFVSKDDRFDNIYLSNFAYINVRDEILRVDGVSDINIFGERDYSIRAWLDPQKLAAHSLTGPDVAAAIRAQNVEAPAGRIGQPPVGRGLSFQYPLDALGRLTTPEQFGEVIVKTGRPSPPSAFARVTSPPPRAIPVPGTTGGGMTGGAATNTGLSSGSSALTTGSLGASSLLGMSGLPGSPGFAQASTGASATGVDIGSGANFGTVTSSTTGSTGTTTGAAAGSTTSGGGTSGGGAGGGASSSSSSSSGGSSGGSGSNAMTDQSSSLGSAADLVTPDSVAAGSSAGGGGASSTNTTGGMVGANALTGGGLENSPWPAAGIVRLRDVARVELAAQSYNNGATFDGRPSVGLAIHLLPGANALDVAESVRKKMKELEPRFPDGLEYYTAYDTTPFIRESVTDVVMTLFEAIGLVAIVVLLFLQNWRAAVIPLIAVPVAILGTFAVMIALGFSLNNISLFGLVLAIGIVVDDAIVVVENVERWLEHGLAPRDAAYRAMDEVTGPVVGIALVLCAVFVPCAFVGGITGQFFRQFAVTITASTVFSAVNSLTLSPALAAILMRPKDKRDGLTRGLDFVLGWFFRLFNRSFEWGTGAYAWAVGGLVRVSPVVLLVYLGLVGLTVFVFEKAPTGFVPDQDQGRIIVSIQLPDSASLRRSQEVMAEVDDIARKTPGVAHTTSAAGMSLVMSANSSNFATVFLILDPFEKRRGPGLSANEIMATLRREFRKVKDADVKVFGAPPVPGLSVASGYKVMVEDRGDIGLGELQAQTDKLVESLNKDPAVVGSLSQFRSKTPQLYMDVDRTKVQSLGVSLDDVNQTMQIYLGSLYVNSFNEFGRHWQVTVQADGDFRAKTEDVNRLQVRNQWGEMVPLGTLVKLREVNGPVSVMRYNLYTAAAVTGNVRPGVSTGTAIQDVDRASAQNLPRSMKTEWTELMFLQIRAGNTAIYVFGLAVVFVFLALAALYESWALPMAVILVVPLCLLCSVGGVMLAGLSVDIFVQIGLVVLVGLACKNAILIVEFAHGLRKQGRIRHEAAVEAARLRLRPILMTSLAFILGVAPLVWATGAGAEMRWSLGTAVFSGMIGVTFFGLFLTPVFFDLIERLAETNLFTSGVVRWVGSAALGLVAGGLIGFLVARVWSGHAVIATAAGAVIGTGLALVVPSLWRRAVPGGLVPRSVHRAGGGQAPPTPPESASPKSDEGSPS